MPHITLNSDGRSHPLVNALAIVTLVLGLLSFVLGLVIRNVPSADSTAMAIVTAVTGLVSLLVGLYAQMISATREERIVDRDWHHRGLRRPGARPGARRILVAGARHML